MYLSQYVMWSYVHSHFVKRMIYSYSIPSRFCICTTERRPLGGGRRGQVSKEQEREMVNKVIANNAICLHEIQQWVIDNQQVFEELMPLVSWFTVFWEKKSLLLKQAFHFPFERSWQRVLSGGLTFGELSMQFWICDRLRQRHLAELAPQEIID